MKVSNFSRRVSFHHIITMFLTLILLQPNCAFAENDWTEYAISEIGVCVSLPDGFDIFLRDMPTDAPVLKEYNLTPDAINDILVPRNLYLDAVSPDGNKEIVVVMVASTISDFSLFGDPVLNAMASGWFSSFEAYGTIVDKYDIFHVGDVTFVRMWEHSASDPNYHILQYYTTYDYQAINFTLHSYAEPVTEAEEALMEEIATRAVFGHREANTNAFAADTAEADFDYTIQDDGTIKITGYNGLQAAITIPETIGGRTVSAIACMERSFAVTTITIPSSVTTVDGNPFKEIDGLRAIGVADGNPAFVAIDGVLYTIDKSVLVCYPRQKVDSIYTITGNTKTIGKDAFYGCKHLTYIEIEEGVETIEEGAFSATYGLTDIYLPRSIKSIVGNPFTYSYNIMSFSVDPRNKYYYSHDGVLFCRSTKALQAFPLNKEPERYAIPEGIVAIGSEAFLSHEASIVFSFPNSLQYIDDMAFAFCSNFQFPPLTGNLAHIGDFAFIGCNGIEQITIPSSVSIGKAAFDSCEGLTTVIMQDSVTEIPERLFYDCSALSYIELPNSLESIGTKAFGYCENLASLRIPSQVGYIGEQAFVECENLLLQIVQNSYAEQYCNTNGIPYAYYDEEAHHLSQRTRYVDPTSQACFYLPLGWVQSTMSKDRVFIDAKFVPEHSDGTSIIFYCEDYWGSLGFFEQTHLTAQGYSRSDCNLSMLSAIDIASTFEVPVETVYTVSYNGIEYFATQIVVNEEVYGINMSVTMTVCVHMHNGYLYMFMYSGTESSSGYSAFESMMETVVYE